MNPIDIVILVILGVFLLKGLLRGLLKEICSLLGLLLGGWLAFSFHAPVGQWLMDSVGVPAQISVGAAFVTLFLGSIILFGVLGFVLSRVASLAFLGGINRVVGGLFGLIQGVALLALVLYGLSQVGPKLPDVLEIALHRSRLSPPFVQLGHEVFSGGRRVIGS